MANCPSSILQIKQFISIPNSSIGHKYLPLKKLKEQSLCPLHGLLFFALNFLLIRKFSLEIHGNHWFTQIVKGKMMSRSAVASECSGCQHLLVESIKIFRSNDIVIWWIQWLIASSVLNTDNVELLLSSLNQIPPQTACLSCYHWFLLFCPHSGLLPSGFWFQYSVKPSSKASTQPYPKVSSQQHLNCWWSLSF